jgi:hypothetical protein
MSAYDAYFAGRFADVELPGVGPRPRVAEPGRGGMRLVSD